jgi:hypothetical protein
MATRKVIRRTRHAKRAPAPLEGQAYTYAKRLLDPWAMSPNGRTTAMGRIGSAPYSAVDGRTIAIRAWLDGYEAALREVRGKRRES